MEWIKRKPKIEYLNSEDITSKLAKIRGIQENEIDDFLMPTEKELFDASEMKNSQKAVNRIIEAINENQKVAVSVDSDVDGITSSAIMIRYLRNYIDNVNYIYHQREDGHGVYSQIKDVVEEGDRQDLNDRNREIVSNSDLLIILDSSSNDFRGIEEVHKLNKDIDIIILDHHQIEWEEEGRDMNDLAILVNPQQEDCEYPNKHLSGAGVTFKIVELTQSNLPIQKVNVGDYYDLVAVGMVADLMRMDILENRYIVSHGLRNIKNVGLTRILKGAKQNPNFVSSTTVGFNIAPIINGSARMGEIEHAIEILLTDDDKVAKKLRLKMDKLNKQRREIQEELTAKYEKMVNLNDKIIIIFDEESNSGFNGLVAQNLAQKYQRPAFVLRSHKGILSGSGRSYAGFNTKDFLSQLPYVITSGHEQSHGITFPEDKLDEVKQFIKDNIKVLKSREPVVFYDIEISADEVPQYVEQIESFNHITGMGFPKIIVKVKDVMITERRVLGATRNTIKWDSVEGINLIKFRVDENYGRDVDVFDTVNAVGEVQMNVFYNFATKETTRTPQVLLEDYRKV